MARKRVLSAEDELRELARKGRRMRQMQSHIARPGDVSMVPACRRTEAEFDRLVTLALEFRTADIPFDLPPEATSGTPQG